MRKSGQKNISPLYSYYALTILTLLNLLNYVDRFIFAALIPYIERDFHFTDEQFGLIGGAFTVIYTILSPIYGYFADRRQRTSLISSGIAIWSLATALGGLAQNYWQLFLARASVGIGEASYVTISPGFLSDYFDRNRRGIAFGVFFAAVPIGQALGFILGAKLGDPEVLGWRHTLYVVGFPGLVLATMAHFLREPVRGAHDDPVETPQQRLSLLKGYEALALNPTFLIATMAYAAMTFSLGILSFWAPKLLVTDKGMSETVAVEKLGIYVTVGGILGTLLGGWLGDLLARSFRQGYFLLCALSAALSSVPLVIAISASDESRVFPMVLLAVLLLFMSNGPVNAIIVNSVAPNLRSTAMATTILAIHFLGDAFSIPLVGSISTGIAKRVASGVPIGYGLESVVSFLNLTMQQSLSIAMLVSPVAVIVSAVFFFLGVFLKQRAQ